MTQDDYSDVDEFIQNSLTQGLGYRRWVHTSYVNAYLRKQLSYREGWGYGICVASISVTQDFGNGWGKRLIEYIEKVNPYSFTVIELVHDSKFEKYLQDTGWIQQPASYPPYNYLKERLMILYIDDEEWRAKPILRELVALGYAVSYFSDLTDAENFYIKHKQQISLVLIDVMVPAEDVNLDDQGYEIALGLDFIQFVNETRFPLIPILIYSYLMDQESLGQLLDCPNVHLLQKSSVTPHTVIADLLTVLTGIKEMLPNAV